MASTQRVFGFTGSLPPLAGDAFTTVGGWLKMRYVKLRHWRTEVAMSVHPAIHTLSAVIVGAALLLGGCGRHGDNGPTISQTLTVEAFDAIDIEGSARLEITIGEPLSVVVRGSEKSVRRVETRVSDETLHIKARAKDWMIRNQQSRLTFQITVPRLESLQLEGGNDVNVMGFAGGDTLIKASGAVNLNADGHLEKLTVRMSGAGHADLGRLVAGAATVTVDGVGSVIVNPRDSLDATMNGVGAIFYTGTPRHVSTRMNGLGTIGQREPSPTPEAEPKQQIDPEQLQPEYDDPKKKQSDKKDAEEADWKKDVTEVI